MALTRRQFIEQGVGTISVFGLSLVRLPGFGGDAQAAEAKEVAEIPVIWMATGACSGCSVALLNSASPTIEELLLDEVLPGKHLSLGFHTTIMGGSGELALSALDRVVSEHRGGYVLIVDGVTAAGADGHYCLVGERADGTPLTGYDQVRDLGRDALAVLAVGACSSFGGIPAAGPNPTDALPVSGVFEREGIDTPLVHIPGCPPHPDWIVGTIATLLLGGVEALALDEHRRPAPFFARTVHDQCPYRGEFERGEFAERFGEHGCLLKLGCKGPATQADCPIRKFNNGTSWCCEAGHPCIGCCHPDFPFEGSMFDPVEPEQLDFPAVYVSTLRDGERKRADIDTYITLGLIGAGGFLAGVGATTAASKLRAQQRAARESGDGSGSQEADDGKD